jgi:hypothetical protein
MQQFIPLTGYAASEIQIRADLAWLDLDTPEVAAVMRAWTGSGLSFDAASAGLIASGLLELSNHCDELAATLRQSNPEEAHANRNASKGLATAYAKATVIAHTEYKSAK